MLFLTMGRDGDAKTGAPFCVLMSLKRRVRAARVCTAQQNLLVRENYVIFVSNYSTSPFLS